MQIIVKVHAINAMAEICKLESKGIK